MPPAVKDERHGDHKNVSSPYIDRLYGRRQDKSLKPRQARLMRELLPRVAIGETVGLDGEPSIDLKAQFPEFSEIWLEIGFGGGEHLAWQAAANRDVLIIGAEPFINGVAKLLVAIEDTNLRNVRIVHGDARPFLSALAPAQIDRLFVLHPDPWPKRRHHKRRLVSPWFFEAAARALRPGSELRIASDIPDYIRWTLMHARAAPDFEWCAKTADDWKVRAEDWPQTRYEQKAIAEGRTPTYLRFKRR
ncbi:MAG: tRNA (guanosine(46)-N7)-methyltransferase TrmB [Pseudomonadota bacterium]